MTGIRSGRLKDQVTIQMRVTTQGSLGGQQFSWVNGVTRRCSIEPINGKEYFSARAEGNDTNIRIRFRYESGLLKPKYRLLDTRVSPNITYDIETVIDPGNEHRELIAMCVFRDQNG